MKTFDITVFLNGISFEPSYIDDSIRINVMSCGISIDITTNAEN